MELNDIEKYSRIVVKSFLKEAREDLREVFEPHLLVDQAVTVELVKARTALFNNVLAQAVSAIETGNKEHFDKVFNASPHESGEEV